MKVRLKRIAFALTLVVLATMTLNFFYGNSRVYSTSSSDELEMPIFKKKPLVIWTNDFHIGPIQDLKTYLAPMGVNFIDKNLDRWRCQLTKTCDGRKSLKVLHTLNGEDLRDEVIPQFYDAYRNDPEIDRVDAFVCFHVASLCELYEPFNKSVLIISTDRYEFGRFAKNRWEKWNRNLIKYASMPRNIIAANNQYDAEYIKYFTGIQTQLVQSFCNYTNASYDPTEKEFLIAMNSNIPFFKMFMENFTQVHKESGHTFKITPIKEKYKFYKFQEIASHLGIVHVPYQVSIMSFFEQYRMNIPLFAPSKELMIKWECEYGALNYRTYNWVTKRTEDWSTIGPHPSQRSVPDPSCRNETSTRYWMNFADYYRFPNIIYYNSLSDLVNILQTITVEELMTVSERMRFFNIEDDKRLRRKWTKILLTIAEHSKNRPH